MRDSLGDMSLSVQEDAFWMLVVTQTEGQDTCHHWQGSVYIA